MEEVQSAEEIGSLLPEVDRTFNDDEGGRGKGMEWPPGQTTSDNPTTMAGEKVKDARPSARSFTLCLQILQVQARLRSHALSHPSSHSESQSVSGL